MAHLLTPCKIALKFYPLHLTQNTGMHWRQEIKREILLSQGQKGFSSSLRENSLTKGKASWFGWVSPEQRLVSGKDGSCRETSPSSWHSKCISGFLHVPWQRQLALQLQWHQGWFWPLLLPLGPGTGAAGQQWCIPPALLSLECYFPLSLCSGFSFWRAFFTLSAPFMCTSTSSKNVYSLLGLSPGHCEQEASKQTDLVQNKRVSFFFPSSALGTIDYFWKFREILACCGAVSSSLLGPHNASHSCGS